MDHKKIKNASEIVIVKDIDISIRDKFFMMGEYKSYNELYQQYFKDYNT